MAELIAPITEDLRADITTLDITKGLEKINYKDEVLGAGLSVAPGDWVAINSSGNAIYPTTTASGATYPVLVGNDQYDAQATGNVTLAVGGGFIYRTTKYVAGSYTVGQSLTVKDLGGGEKVPSAAGGSDAILARVYKAPDAKGFMEILVLNR